MRVRKIEDRYSRIVPLSESLKDYQLLLVYKAIGVKPHSKEN